ncbi:MAG: glycosyltransferase family 39 protein [Planctomycetes bacterium]|nr:glycosyltransferase family 39 protein [Planctomycetota bacterium]
MENGRASGVDVNPGRYWPLAARRSPLALLTLFAILVVPALFSRDLWDPDEPRFAQIGREMLRTGDWVVPRMNGEPLALLPPMHDWVSAACGALAGDVTPAASRAGAALGGLIALAALWWLARRWWGPGAAFWACVVLLTSARFWLQASYAQVDLLLAGLVTASIVAFRVAWEEGDAGLRPFLLGCALAALGTLTKGPVAAVCPGLVFLVLAIADRRRGFLRPAWLAAGLVLFLAIVAPWYWLACRRGGPDFTHELLVKHNFGMFFETWSHHQPPWYYLVQLPWMLAPWIVFLPGAVLDSREALRSAPDAARHRFAWIWFLVLFAFFSISQAKQTKYLLPAFAGAALVLGFHLDRLAAGHGRGLRAALGVLAGVAGLALVVALAACAIPSAKWPIPAAYRDDAGSFAGPALLAALGLAVWLPAPWLARRRPAAALGHAVAGISLAFLATTFAIFPRVDRLKSARPLCERTRPRLAASDEVGIYGIQELKIGAVRYYLDRPLVTFEDATQHPDLAAFTAWWNRPGPRWCVIDSDRFEALPAPLRSSMESVDSQGVGHKRLEIIRRK